MDIKVKKARKETRRRPEWQVQRYGRGYFSPSFREYRTKPRLYISVEGESLLEHFGNRAFRPVKVYRKFLPEILKKVGLPADTKARWSVHAGCSMCPCSPGFVLDMPKGLAFDVYATLSSNAPKAKEGVEALVKDRQKQLLAQV